MRRKLWQQVLFDDPSIPFLHRNRIFLKIKISWKWNTISSTIIRFYIMARPWLFSSTCPTLTRVYSTYLPSGGEEITNSYRMWVTDERNKSRYVTSRLFMIHQLLLMALPLFRPSGHENETWIYVFAPQKRGTPPLSVSPFEWNKSNKTSCTFQ